MELINSLQGQFVAVQHLIFLVSSAMSLEFLISDSIIFRILGPRCCKLFRSLLKVVIGPVVKPVCDGRLLFK